MTDSQDLNQSMLVTLKNQEHEAYFRVPQMQDLYLCQQLNQLYIKMRRRAQCLTQEALPHMKAGLQFFGGNDIQQKYSQYAQELIQTYKNWKTNLAVCEQCKIELQANHEDITFLFHVLQAFIGVKNKPLIRETAKRLSNIFQTFEQKKSCLDTSKTVTIGQAKSRIKKVEQEKQDLVSIEQE